MGMCCCTFVGLPIGMGVGSCAACDLPCCGKRCILQRDPPLVVFRGVAVTMIIIFAFILLVSFCALYIPLSILCAQAQEDKVPWKLYPTEGDCWEQSWAYLGLVAGFLMGFATIGLVVAVCRCGFTLWGVPSSSSSSNTTHDDGDVEAIAIPALCGARNSSTTHDDGDVEASAIPIAFAKAIPMTEYENR